MTRALLSLLLTTAMLFGPLTVSRVRADDVTVKVAGGTLKVKVGAGTGTAKAATCATTTANANGSALVIAEIAVAGGLTLKASKANESVTLDGVTVVDKSKLALGGGTDALAICGADFDDALAV